MMIRHNQRFWFLEVLVECLGTPVILKECLKNLQLFDLIFIIWAPRFIKLSTVTLLLTGLCYSDWATFFVALIGCSANQLRQFLLTNSAQRWFEKQQLVKFFLNQKAPRLLFRPQICQNVATICQATLIYQLYFVSIYDHK